MNTRTKPLLAVIKEAECIGCTKCIQACPVDAIIGSAKYMHTVIAHECIGCKLCLPPCPVDCIDLIAQPETAEIESSDIRQQQAAHIKKRVAARQKRLQKESSPFAVSEEKKAYVVKAVERAKLKKIEDNYERISNPRAKY